MFLIEEELLHLELPTSIIFCYMFISSRVLEQYSIPVNILGLLALNKLE